MIHAPMGALQGFERTRDFVRTPLGTEASILPHSVLRCGEGGFVRHDS